MSEFRDISMVDEARMKASFKTWLDGEMRRARELSTHESAASVDCVARALVRAFAPRRWFVPVFVHNFLTLRAVKRLRLAADMHAKAADLYGSVGR